jgi:hypothetical protein
MDATNNVPTMDATSNTEWLPTNSVCTLKHWRILQHEHEQKSHEVSAPEYALKYRHIPHVGQEYSNAHVEGARAVIMLVSLTKQHTIMKGHRESLHIIVKLLCVPEQYAKMLA